MNGGTMTTGHADFAALAAPVIESVHRATPKEERPDRKVFAGALYDALARAGVEIMLKPVEVITPTREGEPAA